MAASFEVIAQTASGKAKVRYNGIDTVGYRDLDAGEPTSQQAYAAAVGNEQSVYERDDDGEIVSRRVVDDDEPPREPPDDDVSIAAVYRSQRYWMDTDRDYVEAQSWEVRIWITGDDAAEVDERRMDMLEETAVAAIRNGVPGTGGIPAIATRVEEDDPTAEEEQEPVDSDEVVEVGRPEGYVLLKRSYGTYVYEIKFVSESLEQTTRSTLPTP